MRCLLLLLLLACPLQAATLYKWTDAQGLTHYTDDPPPADRAAERITVRSGKPEAPPASSAPAARDADWQRMETRARQAQARAERVYRQRRCDEARAATRAETASTAGQGPQRHEPPGRLAKEIDRWCD